ncbi:MAG: three-Cys-motif partner protein TcmP [Flexilinea sp.]|nr:three-Cys-motif partner protein TcmP [Flexilinea sp.]
MNKRPELIDKLNISTKKLDSIKTQTEYKIKYVTGYVEQWLYVAANSSRKNIVFIDSMANAGIYKNGILGTSPEVLLKFIGFAEKHQDKNFFLFVNEIDKDRLSEHEKIVSYFLSNCNLSNISIDYSNQDVNSYLENYQKFDPFLYSKDSFCILFIDPYNFHTVEIFKIQEFVKRYYCEVLFNVFTSDKIRNEDSADIQKCLGSIKITDKNTIITEMAKNLRVGNIKYIFSYPFRISTNIELYQILYLTPNIRGLEKLKDVIWDVFDGARYYRTYNNSIDQLSLFDKNQIQDNSAQQFAIDAQELLLTNFSGRELHFNQIQNYIIEETLLKPSHVINKVIKPLIKSEKIIKKNYTKKQNYKDDWYSVK